MKKGILLVFALLLFVTGCTASNEKDISFYIGVWKNNESSLADEKITIREITDNRVVFDYSFYRLCDFYNIEAILNGDTASFVAINDLEWTISGTITLKDNYVTINVTDSSVDLIEQKERVFDNKTALDPYKEE